MADQRLMEYELWHIHGVAVEFITLAEANDNCFVDQSGNLHYKSKSASTPKTVSVVYYRAGYTPNDYPSELEWKARGLIESSKAIKCPSVGYQLAGTKKVQQSLCEEGILERFLARDGDLHIPTLRSVFAGKLSFPIVYDILSHLTHPGQFSLTNMNNAATAKAVDAAIADGSKWVLKPQREGGGNNLYGNELSEFLSKHRKDPILGGYLNCLITDFGSNMLILGYILMERIFPRPQNNVLIRNEQMLAATCINEIGIYGIFVGDGSDSALVNREAGYLVRTKPVGIDEGGVATGYSVLNSLVLLGEDDSVNPAIDTEDPY
jgi:glutathione synthase